MTYQKSFEKLATIVDGLDASKVEGHFAYQFEITGNSDKGIFYVEIKDGVIKAEPYDYVDNNGVGVATTPELAKYFKGEKSNVKKYGDFAAIDGVIDYSKKPVEAPKKSPATKTKVEKVVEDVAKEDKKEIKTSTTPEKKTSTAKTCSSSNKKTTK